MSGDDGDRDEKEPRRERERPRARYEDDRVAHGPGHVSADLEWVMSDEDDPDAGSGRTDADDGGYLPGEGTGRPFR